MTIVAAKKYPDSKKIIFSSDNLVVAHNCTKETSHGIGKPSIKLLQTTDMIIGGSGNLVDITLLFMYAKTNKPHDTKLESIVKWLTEFYKVDRPGFTPSDYNQYLLAFKDKLFNISDLYHVQEVAEFYTIGSGSRYAQAALYLGFDTDRAVETACEFDTGCGGDIFSYTHNF
jgi:ATP-dependent protease HslVU (ClpYQ) peptidase subunit